MQAERFSGNIVITMAVRKMRKPVHPLSTNRLMRVMLTVKLNRRILNGPPSGNKGTQSLPNCDQKKRSGSDFSGVILLAFAALAGVIKGYGNVRASRRGF
jgi:hypothetical protein